MTRLALLLSAVTLAIPFTAAAENSLDTTPPAPIHGAHFPSLSPDGKSVCFEYRGDLWVCASTGGTARRLTVHKAYDGWPRWSPDGNWIAFSSSRRGNLDIYLMPAQGGEARQITFNSADDVACDWAPDGSKILFQSGRDGRFTGVYSVDVVSGRVVRLTPDDAPSRYGTMSRDGKRLLYTRGGQPYVRTKYTGSLAASIGAVDLATHEVTPVRRRNAWDGWPMEAPDGKTLYFVSARGGGVTNIWRLDETTGALAQVTHFAKGTVRYPAMALNGSAIAFEHESSLCVVRLDASSEVRALSIVAPYDPLENTTNRVRETNGFRGLDLSHDAKTLVFTSHGRLFTAPADGGDATALTPAGPGWRDAPAWAPDGKRIAYLDDRAGKLDVYLFDVSAKTERALTSDASDKVAPAFAPNGKLLAYVRTGGATPGLIVHPVAPPGVTEQPKGDQWQPLCAAPGPNIGNFAWSPDSRWLAFEQRDAYGTTDVWVVPAAGGSPVNVTQYPGSNGKPAWTPDGRSLLFYSNRGGGLSEAPPNLYRVALRQDSDEPRVAPASAPAPARRRRQSEMQAQPQPQPQGPPPPPGGPVAGIAAPVVIDFDGIEKRAKPVTNTRDDIGDYVILPDSRTVLYYVRSGVAGFWWQADLANGSAQRITNQADIGTIVGVDATSGKVFMLGLNGAPYVLVRTPNGNTTSAVVTPAQLTVDDGAEIREAFNEAWRNLRTHFYDPDMHGVDWAALRAKYEALIPETSNSQDLSLLLTEMIGELNASHMGATPPREPGPQAVTGCLGLGYDDTFRGPGLKVVSVMPDGPTDRPGKHVEPGQYILAIDGTDVKHSEHAASLLEGTVGRDVRLLVNSRPARDGAWEVTVKPIDRAALDDLEYEKFVNDRRALVDRESKGKVAYLHIRAMKPESFERFQRELFGYAQSRKALILDIRYNPGGRIHDDILALLERKPHAYETPRDSLTVTQPFALWNRPIVLMINEYSASDSEVLANAFHELKLGPIVGTRTSGSVIGTYDITLVDGTRFRIPHTAWRSLAGKELENNGAQPDIPVDPLPGRSDAAHDVQLDAALKEALRELPKAAR